MIRSGTAVGAGAGLDDPVWDLSYLMFVFPTDCPLLLSQGPVIYAQLDHSGSNNLYHKKEQVVYADIRKN